ncbi:MAG: hypothetical protein K8T26_09990 [Lentisphaerae bacterium]|nr:hypothetical protein [Lentisphaerota bacterium]
MRIDRLTVACGMLLLASRIGWGEPEPASPSPNQAESDRLDKIHLAAFATNPAVMVLPGLVADRNRREVRMLAESTKITAVDPVEFALIAPDSDHAYESLAVAFAKPSAVDEALRFIGLTPGRPATPRDLAFWPKGERVLMSVTCLASNGWTGTRPLEELLWDTQAGAPPPATGLVFVEAGQPVPPDASAPAVFLPDVADPNAIASMYNETATVLDVPRIAPQGSVYGLQKLNPELVLPPRTLLQFTLRPERPAGNPRVLDLTLTVLPSPTSPMYALTPAAGSVAGEPVSSDGLAQAVSALVRDGRDPFVRIRFDDRLHLDEIHGACLVLKGLEREDGLRIEPPDADQLFYRAFIPDEQNRRREDRVAQPLELRLHRADGVLGASLTKIDEHWRDDRPEPDLTSEDYPLASPEDMRPTLEKIGSSMPVLLVFATPEVTLAELMAYVAPARPTHSIVHIYMDSIPVGDPATNSPTMRE